MIGAKKMQFDQYAGHCIVSNFRLHRDSHTQILTATETPFAPTLARSKLFHLSSLDWPSWLLLPAASALSCHLHADHPVSLHIVDRHWWKRCLAVFHLCSSFSSHTRVFRMSFSYRSIECRYLRLGQLMWAGKRSRPVCVIIYSRRVRVIFKISRQNPKM